MTAVASRDNDLVAQLVEGLGEPASNTRSAAGDRRSCCPKVSWVVSFASKAVAEHWQPAYGVGFRRFVLKDVPVLRELSVFDAYDVGGDPSSRTTIA
jgi:hypothetical protein